jgi:hypothetical protein
MPRNVLRVLATMRPTPWKGETALEQQAFGQ